MPLHAVSMHHMKLKILAGFLTRQLCQNILSHKCIDSTSEVESLERSHCVCWLKARPVSCVLFWWPSSGMAWEDPETHPRQFEMLERLLKRVSHGSDRSAFESSAQFGSVLILAQALQHCHVNPVYQFLSQRYVLQDFCTLVLKCPSTAWASQNRRFLIFLYHRKFGYWAWGESSACWGCCKSCAAVMRNVVILWFQSWNTDVWSLFLFIRPVLAAVSRTQGEQWRQIPNPLFVLVLAIPGHLPRSWAHVQYSHLRWSPLWYGAVSWLCPSSGTPNHDVTECELPGISLSSQTFPHCLGLKTSHQRFIAFLFALYFLLSR